MATGTVSQTLTAEFPVRVTNVDKILWPKLGITKADYIDYLVQVAQVLLSHLKDRPLTVVRYPHGITGTSFYQKNAPPDTPEWVRTYSVYSEDSKREIQYVLAEHTSTLIWLANQACLELHPWFSTASHPDEPTNLAFDLDPTVPGFEKVRRVALYLKEILDDLHLPSYPKTSGATGLQIFIPIRNGYTYEQTRKITHFVALYMERQYPDIVTLERFVKNRGTKVYVDYLQHAQHKTLVAPYSPRPVPEAKVSAPVTWKELEDGALPEDFTIQTMPKRISQYGDLFHPMSQPGVDLQGILDFIQRI